MFATIPPVQPSSFQGPCSYFSPTHSSPLSPRSSTLAASRPMDSFASIHRASDTNRAGSETHQTFNFSLFTDNGSTITNTNINNATTSPNTLSSRSRSSPSYAQRYATISNPLSNATRSYSTSTSPSARTARRNMFLNRIKQDRDAGRFENRGEQMMMMECVAEQKQWEELMRRRADGLVWGYALDEEVGDGEMERLDEVDVHALDEYVSEEQAMETALLENMPMQMYQSQEQGREQGQAGRAPAGNMAGFHDTGASFSDEEEYDDIFMDLADQGPQGQDMDMST
ncbi:uncharacterized protein ACLA_038870 [Aspergillus clavatus NRRL 1]|uniref:Uncharacterized protein n=1 Tax=Aspergillus clavatus (strain ATCC 1007 / CBS 513.65 / DSM 816 / NCTC 3887 / NRRL 1 / QM 1276 / 107) TaxID=344612 RepID=A1CKJ8_ASPCL|nr:uncharacterized protein ACLA_038870 [Aspergillus clavatus NRRL 1]EAW09672.1 conserved hypothetical protein [Aspergillus clavatus NRRL 1]